MSTSTATAYQDLIAEVALQYNPDEVATIECGTPQKAHNHYVYLRRARAGVIRHLPQARNVDISREGSTVIVRNTYDPAITVTRAKLPTAPLPERSNVDPSGAATLTQDQERFVKLLREDYEDGEISETGVIAALDEADIPKEVATWL